MNDKNPAAEGELGRDAASASPSANGGLVFREKKGSKMGSSSKRKSSAVMKEESGDDELPLASMLRSKKLRVAKKEKVVLDDFATGGGSLSGGIETRPALRSELGTTLASFRKRLKGPRRLTGSRDVSGYLQGKRSRKGKKGVVEVHVGPGGSPDVSSGDSDSLFAYMQRARTGGSKQKRQIESVAGGNGDDLGQSSGKVAEDSPVPLVGELISGGAFSTVSDGVPVGTVGRRQKDRKSCNGFSAEAKELAFNDYSSYAGDNLDGSSNKVLEDLSVPLVEHRTPVGVPVGTVQRRRRCRNSRGGSVAEVKEVDSGVDVDLVHTGEGGQVLVPTLNGSLEGRLHAVVGKGPSSSGRKGRVKTQKSGKISSGSSGRTGRKYLSRSGLEDSSVSALKVEEEAVRLDATGFLRSEGNLDSNEPSVPEPKERFGPTKEVGDDKLNQNSDGALKVLLPQEKKEKVQSMVSGLKHCSNGDLEGLVREPVFGASSKSSAEEPMTLATSTKDEPSEPSHGNPALVQDSCPGKSLATSEVPAKSEVLLNQLSVGEPHVKSLLPKPTSEVLEQVADGHLDEVGKTLPIDNTNLDKEYPFLPSEEAFEELYAHSEKLPSNYKRESAEETEGREPLEKPSEIVMEDCPSSLDENLQSIVRDQEGISVPGDGINEQCDENLLGSSLSCFGKDNEDNQNFNGVSDQLPKEDLVCTKSPCRSDTTHAANLECDYRLPQSFLGSVSIITSNAAKQSDTSSAANSKVSSASDDSLNQFAEVNLLVNQCSAGASKEPSQVGSGELVSMKDVHAPCSQKIIVEIKETGELDAIAVSTRETIDNELVAPRTARIPKKRKHGDMAYEGDFDWEVLVHEQGLFTNVPSVGGDRFARTKEKLNSSDTLGDATCGGMAAVAAGLKASAANPIERIKFKEILKRKGGLQEYLDCRNFVLGLWHKDVKHTLLLEECGISPAPSKDESPRASLLRETFIFLDRNGYINAGIALGKERPIPYGLPEFVLSEGSKAKSTCTGKIGNPKDELASLPNQFEISENIGYPGVGRTVNLNASTIGSELFTSVRSEEYATCSLELDIKPISPTCEIQPCDTVADGNDTCLDGKEIQHHDQEQGRMPTSDSPNADPSHMITGGLNYFSSLSSDMLHLGKTDQTEVANNESSGIMSAAEQLQENCNTECDYDDHKRVIIVGAGPAGLTAARHLQRQGFSVIVLEARDRIGGRVYTDRSSLSVPVDLGASIITGVEADVATERRPDPSSLVCSQLGLELTILNSDCPLYDVVTGHKVPADLDEALEAEYNGLLDDMVPFVAQNSENAVKMSLEDGLEYALRRHRLACSAAAAVELDHSKVGSGIIDSWLSAPTDLRTVKGDDNARRTNSLSPLERRVMDWHFANLEYGCAALLKDVSLPYWNQDDIYGGFGGAHCMIKGGYSTVVESLSKGLNIHLNHPVTDITYNTSDSEGSCQQKDIVKVCTSNGREFLGDAVLITVPLGCLKANTIKFSPVLPEWKESSIRRLGFGVLNKVVLEFPEVFWDDAVDYFGATAEETGRRGQCFMFWNVKKTVGAPVLIALVVGKAAIDGENISTSDHVNHALKILRKLFGDSCVPDPVASVVTNWGVDPFSRGAYSYVAVGASGEDYDILGKPVANCLFFAGEATCKEHPDTVGGAMMSGLREAVRIIDIFTTGKDYAAEVEEMEAVQRRLDSGRSELKDLSKKLDGMHAVLSKEVILRDLFSNAKTTSARLHLAKEMLRLPVEVLKSFTGNKQGLSTLNSWILDSLGKNATQLLRHCVRLLMLVSTDLLAVRLSGIGKTIKDKVCMHTSRDIRAIASQLVNMWIDVFRKEKAANGGLRLLKQPTSESSKFRSKDITAGKVRVTSEASEIRANLLVPSSAGNQSPSIQSHNKKIDSRTSRLEILIDAKSVANSSRSHSLIQGQDSKVEEDMVVSEEEAAALAAAEAARAAALAAAEAFASSEAEINTLRELPKIPSFHKFARRDQYTQVDDSDLRRRWSGGIHSRQDCISEIDSRNCKVRNWSVDFTAACSNLEGSKMSADNYTQRSNSNEMAYPNSFREHSGESGAMDSRLTKAWVDMDAVCSGGVKDYLAIERWQSQAMDADADFFSRLHVRDEEDSNKMFVTPPAKGNGQIEQSSASQTAENKLSVEGQPRGVEHIRQGLLDYVASLLMPLYKTRKIDKEGYKSIMKKTATKVMEQCTEAEKMMTAYEFLDFKRKNKIRSFVDKLIERHMAMNPSTKS
ncbi:lysine-specific histone demethylase 1-like protein 3 [Iris pallida]|uniref:Lysine-specific histone demethylase 1-like protein 3 n=1 Tax=Iris pallida TaxID=29817 RepID=A0AAX6HRM8_IRIPA|nr:lysine-specific histone demethylase 1-like protein 3 [Iris pallida]